MGRVHNADPQSYPVPTKICGGPCGQRLPLTEYHVNNNRPDKRHLYCKNCMLEKVRVHRENLRVYKAARGLRSLRRRRDESTVIAHV